MPDRSVTVRARFDVSGILAGARAGALAVRSFAGEVEKASGKQRQAFDAVGASAVGVGGAMVAGFGMAVRATVQFDREMSKVGAVSGATGKQLAALRESAIDAGQATAFSATQAAEAQGELAKAGISTADILGGALRGSLDLAAAGGLDLAEAATIAAQAMNIFGLKGKDVTHIADVLAAGANKSAADVHQLGEAMRAGGNTSAQFGLSMEETVGVLSAFADNALIGSDAGTSLKTMLLHLANPAAKTQDLMDQLGIAAYNAQGNFVGMASLAQQLQERLGHLTQAERDQAIAQIFGSDAMRGAAVLYKIGAQGVQEYTRAVNDQGAAGRMAGQMMDNLAGDLEKLKGSLETALIQGGSAATGVLRGMTQAATLAVDTFGALPGPVQGAVTVVTGLTGAVTLLGGAMVVAVPKIQAYKAALAEAGPRTQAIGKGLSAVGGLLTGPWGLAMGAGALALGVFAAKHAEAEQRAKELRDTLDQQTGALTDNSRAMVTNRLETDGVLKAAKQLRLNLGDVVNAALGQRDALDRVNTGLSTARDRARALDDQYGGGIAAQQEYSMNALAVRSALDGTNQQLKDQIDSVRRQAEAQKGAASTAGSAVAPVGQLGDAVGDLGGEADNAASKVRELKDQLDAVFNPSIAAFKAATNLKSGYRDLIKQMVEAGGRMDGNTESSTRLRQAFAGQLETVVDLYKSTLDQTSSEQKASKAIREQIPILYALAGKNKDARDQVDALARATGTASGVAKTSRKAFLEAADSMGISRQRARELWKEYALLKDKINKATSGIHDKKVKVTLSFGSKMEATKGQLSEILRRQGFASGGVIRLADGGVLPGYTPGRDVHSFISPTGGRLDLSGGEAVMRPEWTEAVGPQRVAAWNAAARTGGAAGVARAMGVDRKWLTGRNAIGLEGAAFAGGGVIAQNKVTGGTDTLAKIRAADRAYGTYASQLDRDLTTALSGLLAGGPGAQKALAWARTQAGKPYVWGGVGPGGYDCSGLASALVNVAKGRSPYSRLFTTFSFTGAGDGPQGFVRNLPAGIRVGVTNAGVGHMASTVAGVNVESRGSAGVLIGPNARGADNGLFSMRYGLKGYDQGGILPPGVTTAYNGTGRNEYVFTQQQIEAGYANGGFGSVSVAFRPGNTGGDLASAAKDLKEVAKALRDVVGLRDGLDKLTGSVFAQERALSGYEAAWDSALASLKENGKTLNVTTAKGRENRSALLGLAEAAQEVVSAMRDMNKPSSQIVAKMAEQRKEFIRMARAMGLTLAQAKKLADRYGLVPSKVKGILAKESKDLAYNKKAEAYNKTIEAKASGGPAGGWTLLGEEGPELTWLPGGSYVVPANRTRALLAGGQRRAIPTSGGGGSSAPLHVTVMVGDRTLGELVIDPIRKAVKTRGGDVQAVLGTRR
ncbi:phage tail tape measure protein [Microbispora amethystogenes]|uniref:phage tail tape measure protein n=1 Tax=Microbispora amethystogenes TaxID=1427754 RepID=UPI003F4D609A